MSNMPVGLAVGGLNRLNHLGHQFRPARLVVCAEPRPVVALTSGSLKNKEFRTRLYS